MEYTSDGIVLKRFRIRWKAYERGNYKTAYIYAYHKDDAIEAIQETEQREMLYPEVDSSEDVIIGKVFDKYGGKPTWLAR